MPNKLQLGAAGLLFITASAHAQIITVNYTGSVTDLGILLEGDSVSIGSTVTGSFSYDTEAGGALTSFSISIGDSFTATMTGSGSMNVQNDQQNGAATLPADGLTAFTSDTTSSSLNGYADPAMQFGLRRDNIDGQLWDDTLPPDLADWANITLADINSADWHWMDFGLVTDNFRDDQIRWDVDSFEVAAVPIPAAAWLFGSGLLGLVGFTRRQIRA